MEKSIAIFEAKNTLTSCIRQVETAGPITLTRHNKEVAVLISKTDFDNLSKQSSFAELSNFRQKYQSDLQSLQNVFEDVRQRDTQRTKDSIF